MAIGLGNFEDSLQATSIGAVAVGDPLLTTSGDLMGFAATTAAAAGTVVTYRVWGLVTGIAKDTAHAWRVGDEIYWDRVALVATRRPTDQRLGRANAVQIAAATTGDVVVMAQPGTIIGNILASSTAITNLTAETTFSNGTVNIPANFLTDGSVLRIRGKGTVPSHNSTDTLNVKVKFAGVQVVATGAINNAAGDIFVFDVLVVVRLSGAAGTFVGHGAASSGVAETATLKLDGVASTAIDTTAIQPITVTGTWSVANAADQAVLDMLTVELVR